MTNENRAEARFCPDCGTPPILRSSGDMFCDICNRYLQQTLRYPVEQ